MPSQRPQSLNLQKTDSQPSSSLGSICEAATSLFLTNTFQAVSLREIAELSGVPKGSMHKLTGGKHELLFQILRSFEHGFLEELNYQVPRSSDCQMAMRMFTETYIKYGAARRDQLQLARRDLHLLPQARQKSIQIVRDKVVTRVWEITAVGHAKKIFCIPDLRFSAKVIVATLDGVLTNPTLTSNQLIDSIPLLQVMVIQFASAGRRP